MEGVELVRGEGRRISLSEVLGFIKDRGVRYVNLQFTDLYGRLKQTTLTAWSVDLSLFEEGAPKLDGSSIRGFVEIQESDMVLKPDPSTLAIVPWLERNGHQTIRFISDVYLGFGQGRFSRDPRWVAEKAREYVEKLGFRALCAAETEFFILDRVSWDTLTPYRGMGYMINAVEAPWNGDGSYPMRFKEGYYPADPQDTLIQLRSEVVDILEDYFGVKSLVHHHEVAAAGQCEINILPSDLVGTPDNLITLKYVVRNVAKKYGKVATFMPKPIFGDNASGMHVHISLWQDDKNVFYDPSDEYAELSQVGRYFIGGLLDHARSLSAIVSPTTNSYKRLVPGYEAPVYLAWSKGNRSAAVRVPIYKKGVGDRKRIEYRPPDPSCNPYLALAAITLAGIDGIKKKMDPGDPIDEDIYKMPESRRGQLGIKELPGSLLEAVKELNSDKDYLKPAFTEDVIEKLSEKAERDEKEINMRPHPHEFQLYFDI